MQQGIGQKRVAGKIKYSVQFGKFAGGKHSFGAKIKRDIEDQGVLKFRVNSIIGDNGVYATGDGRLFVNVFCSYKGKDGKKHKGKIGSTYLNVKFGPPH